MNPEVTKLIKLNDSISTIVGKLADFQLTISSIMTTAPAAETVEMVKTVLIKMHEDAINELIKS
jgi:hypothetical protein